VADKRTCYGCDQGSRGMHWVVVRGVALGIAIGHCFITTSAVLHWALPLDSVSSTHRQHCIGHCAHCSTQLPCHCFSVKCPQSPKAMQAPNYDVFIDQMLPRGGLRRQRHDAELPRTQARSQLAQLLLEQWAWGAIGAQRVQAIANASVADGAHHPEVLQLAGIGNKGQCPGNCHRDLLRILASKVVMPSPVGMTVPLKVQDEVEMLALPMMPMHRMVAHMHSHYPLEFGKGLLGPQVRLQASGHRSRPQTPSGWLGSMPWKQNRLSGDIVCHWHCMVMVCLCSEAKASILSVVLHCWPVDPALTKNCSSHVIGVIWQTRTKLTKPWTQRTRSGGTSNGTCWHCGQDCTHLATLMDSLGLQEQQRPVLLENH